MFDTLRLDPGADTFDAVKSEILKLRSTYQGLITVALPTSITSNFFKKQLENEFDSLFGVRFYSHADVVSIIQDISVDEFSFQKSNHVSNVFHLKEISDKISGPESSWMKISVIETTLSMLNGINDKQFDLLEKINPEAHNITAQYMKLRNQTLNGQSDISAQLEMIFGKLIVIHHESIPGSANRLLDKCSSIVHQEIVQKIKNNDKFDSIYKFADTYDELSHVLDLAVEESASLNLSEMAIVVPNEQTKQLLIAIAKAKKIPLAGSETYDAYQDPVMLAARYFLDNKHALINDFFIENFYTRFSWLRNKNSQKDSENLIQTCKKIYAANTLHEYFNAIIDFLENGYEKLISFQADKKIELINSQFSLLKQLSDSNKPITTIEAAFLLKKFCSSLSYRIDTLGNGIYVCKPTEIIGTHFKKLFITNMNVSYLKEEIQVNTMLTTYDIDTLGLSRDNNSRTRETNESIMNWLLGCSDSYTISTSDTDCSGRTLLQNITFDAIFSKIEYTTLNTFNTLVPDENRIQEQIDYLGNFFDTNLNDSNILIEPDRITSFNVSSIDLLAKCPFKFFITKVLKTNELVENENIDLITAMERGSLIHEVLEKVGLDKFDLDNISVLINDKIADLIKSNLLPNQASGTINKIEVANLIETCLMIHKHKLETGSRVFSVEEKLNGDIETENGLVSFTGKIDRIDINKDSTYSIIDYKTGELEQKTDFFDFGKKLQLGIYGLLLEEKLDVVSLEYWYLKKNPEALIERVTVNDDTVEYIKRLVDSITSIMTNGVIAPRTYSFTQDKLQKKDSDIKTIDNCKNCEVSNICYTEHQEMWKSLALKNKTEKYREATGDLEESNTQ